VAELTTRELEPLRERARRQRAVLVLVSEEAARQLHDESRPVTIRIEPDVDDDPDVRTLVFTEARV
jgi:hypothetical protein